MTISVLAGVLYGPLVAWQAADRPAQPWHETRCSVRALVVLGLLLGAVLVVVLVVLGRPLLAALLVASSAASYFVANYRRSRLPR